MNPTIRLLYAEDNPQDADLTRAHFAEKALDFDLQIVATGAECLEQIQRSPPDLLLLDHHLPDTDGVEMLKALLPQAPGLPVVLVTGGGDEGLVLHAKRLGAANYVPKHLNYLDSLPGLLREVLAERGRKHGKGPVGSPPLRRVLYVEWQAMDIDLTLQHFAEHAPHLAVEAVHTCAEALVRLAQPPAYDLLLVDRRMPDQDGLEFLREAKARCLHLPPFMLISGVGDEKTALAALGLGAADFVVKSEGYLDQLPFRVDLAITGAELARNNEDLRAELASRKQSDAALRTSEEKFRVVAEHTYDWEKWDDPEGAILYCSPSCERITGHAPDDFKADPGLLERLIHPEDLARWRAHCAAVHAGSATQEREQDIGQEVAFRILRPDGEVRWVDHVCHRIFDSEGRDLGNRISNRDVTERRRAEEATRASRDRLSLALDVADAGVWEWVPATGEAVWSDKLWNLYGLEPGICRPSFDEWVATIHPEDRPATTEALRRAAREGTGFAKEWRVRLVDGSTRWLLGHGAPVKDRSGASERYGGIVVDITSRKASEELAAEVERLAAVAEREAQLRAYFNSPVVGIAVMSPERGWMEVNAQLCAMLGYTRSELVGKTWAELTYPEDLEVDIAEFGRVIAGEIDSYSLEARFIRKDRSVLWALLSMSCSRRGNRTPDFFVAILMDITNRKVAEASLKESERHHRELLDNLNAGVVVHSPDTSVVRINKKASILLGLSPGQKLGEAATDPSRRFVHEDGTTIPSEEYPVARVLATGAPIVNQVLGVGRPENRDRSWLLLNAYPEVDAAGALEQVVVTFVDITRRKEIEEALRETQELLRLAMDQSPVGIAIADAPSGTLRYVNDAALLIRGGDRASVVNGVGIDRYVASWQLLDLDGTPLPSDAVPLARSILYGETNSREFIIRRSETDDRIVSARAAPVIDIHGKVTSAVVVFMDVTEAKRAGQAVARSEAKYRGLFDSLMDGFAIVDMDGVIQESNAVFQSMLGYSAEELRQKTMQDLTPQPWQGVQARILEEQVLRRGYSDVYEQEYRRKDGTIFPVELRTFLLSEAGRPVAMWTINRDVSDSRAMQAQLALASRLAALGTLVAGVAHEVNNPLAAALANQEMALSAVEGLRSRLGGDATVDRESEVRQLGEVVEELADAQEAARRIERIVKDLKTFGRSDSKRTRVRLIDVVEASMRWLPVSIDRTATVRVENGNPPDIVAAFGQIEQVVVNLVTNAAKASSPQERGKVIVRLGPGADGMARLEVIDHGKGIEPKILARIFDPFFTTRDVGEGMGLGLSISQAIVTSHGGTLTVETEVDKGTTFRMELPAALAEA